MNLRSGALVGLLCIGLASAQLNFRPEFISAGQGFRAANAFQNQGTPSVTRQQESGGGYSTHTVTTGVQLKPFFKKTSVTSAGYDYPVPCPEPQVCTPRDYCVQGQVQEAQLSLFDSTKHSCNSETEQCCSIVRAPPTQCPDNTYVCVSQSLCNNGVLSYDAQNSISAQQQSGVCYSPDVCCKTQGQIADSTILTDEGYVVRVPENQYLPPEGQNSNNNFQTAPPPRPPTTPSPPPPTTTQRYIPPPTTPQYIPPSTTQRYVPPPTTQRYVQQTTTQRYFPPPPTTRPPFTGNEYIPPREEIPAPSNTDPNAVRPPQDENPSPANDTPVVIRPNPPRPSPPGGDAPPPLPPVGCSAAMNCTERQFCSSTGVISKTPVNLTPEQELYRVPVTDCRNPEKGFTGVCCRDPDYVDPWPVGMLGLYNPEILPFDDGSYKPNGNGGNGNAVAAGNTNGAARNEAIQASQSRITTAQTYGPNQLTSSGTQTRFTQSKTQYSSSGTTQLGNSQFGTGATRSQYTTSGATQPQYNNGVTAAASSQSTTAIRRQQTTSVGTTSINGGNGDKRFTPSGLQFVNSGNTQFKPFQKQTAGQCAPRNYNTQPRGAGQWDTGFGEFPWMAMVILESNKTLLCGGAIISENTVVTAANCVNGLNPRDIMIKGGEWRLGVDAEPKTFQIVRVKDVAFHPAYNPTTLNYDVAMLILEDRLRFDTHIGSLCLDENDVVPSASYENCVTTGWGREVLRIHIGNALMRYMPISLLSESESQRQLQTNGFAAESHICGRPAADACDVDIGSALACADTSGTYYLKGVYSQDNGCGRPDQIVSFSNIDVQWIKQVLKNPNQFITPVPNYQTAANSPVISTVQQPSTLVPQYGKAYLPPY
ncbi:inactive serine protease scarface-like isoform X3 [Uranotaenia lowii]|uniref:inactive serine protease scarface-like isoform X3 n=1 Tax=Uranotaenia lowii TaxID=190385 RepID=UPI00247B2030|nr:inactive serine protease scarface-like isoform X3 [Uranotaenia lowii]XP_055594897.1 inactive serine protease scarface-like isoform X3 [Uranotaenia lowii]